MVDILPLQETLRPALPKVIGCVDYTNFETNLQIVDTILRESKIEALFVRLSLEGFLAKATEAGNQISAKAHERHQRQSERALRCTILKNLLSGSYREISRRLAECPLFRWFCRLGEFETIQVPGKSTLQDYAHWLPEEQMRQVLDAVTEAATATDHEGHSVIGLANALELETVWVDTTCLKANIHYPIDWVLLRDATRTLMGSVALIRKHGLLHRMEEPSVFTARMNALCMEMSAARRAPNSKKQRKEVLRKMKRLVKNVESHARRYRQLLDQEWAKTDWTRKQAEITLRRIDGVLEVLPAALDQAHERIIGERKVASSEKRLSLYEANIHVIVRGKSGAEVEFGNSLFLAEQTDGFIVDHELKRERSPGDAKWLEQRIDPINALSRGSLAGLFTDRGFESRRNIQILKEKKIDNGLCPRDPKRLCERLKDQEFVAGQKRRAQTEARIGILKNAFLDGTPRAKGFENRQMAVAWAVMTHNLWLLAQLPRADQAEKAPPSAMAA